MSILKNWVRELNRDPDYRLERDNDINFHVARNLFELRKIRGYTQEELATRMGTSQPKVAAAEGGVANLTFKTFRRFIDALDGRLQIAVLPKEYDPPRLPSWWTLDEETLLHSSSAWERVWSVDGRLDTGSQFFVAGWASKSQAELESSKTRKLVAQIDEGLGDSWFLEDLAEADYGQIIVEATTGAGDASEREGVQGADTQASARATGGRETRPVRGARIGVRGGRG